MVRPPSRTDPRAMTHSSLLKPLIISAPFGNYVQPAGATATLGTFTADPRPGRWWRVLRTVRYYPRLEAWVNRIGLRNPGMPWLLRRAEAGRTDVADKIVSIHGFTDDQWRTLLDQADALHPAAIELNMSCPNVGELDCPPKLFDWAAAIDTPVIVKLPPVNYDRIFDRARQAGLRAFHCCNTLPVPAGGLSGRPLKPVALQCIRDLIARLSESERGEITLIGGGGIREPADIDDYADAGADHFAIGTKVMNPRYLWSYKPLTPLIDRAGARSTASPAPRQSPQHTGQ